MGKTCENCNHNIDHQAFCPHCGLAQVCTNCHHPFQEGEKFCAECGEVRKKPSVSVEQSKVHNPQFEQQEQVLFHQEQISTEPQKKRKLTPIIIGAIVAVIAFILIINPHLYMSDEKLIEKTVTDFMKAVEKGDINKIQKLSQPNTFDIDDIADFLFMRAASDVSIDVHSFYDFRIFDIFAEVTALVSVESKFYREKFTDELYAELIKVKNKWYIVDVY